MRVSNFLRFSKLFVINFLKVLNDQENEDTLRALISSKKCSKLFTNTALRIISVAKKLSTKCCSAFEALKLDDLKILLVTVTKCIKK